MQTARAVEELYRAVGELQPATGFVPSQVHTEQSTAAESSRFVVLFGTFVVALVDTWWVGLSARYRHLYEQ